MIGYADQDDSATYILINQMSKIKMETGWGKWMVEEGEHGGAVRLDGQPLGREEHLIEARLCAEVA